MLTALDRNLNAINISKAGIDETLFCPCCGEDVKITTISEKTKKKKKKDTLDTYIPFEKSVTIFVHTKKECCPWQERETVEHVHMKYSTAIAFKPLGVALDVGLPGKAREVYIHDKQLTIECQSSQITKKNLREVLEYFRGHQLRTMFIWGHRVFSRMKESDNHQYWTLRATVAEQAYLTNYHDLIPTLDNHGFRQALKDSLLPGNPGPIFYIFFKDGKLQWMHILRHVNNSYLGTVHQLNVQNLTVEDDGKGHAVFRR